MAGSTQWTDLDSVLSDTDGKACLYGYLGAMDVGDSAPRRLYKHIELLDEIALFRQEAGDAQKRAQRIVDQYVTPNSAPGGLYVSAPSLEQLRQPEVRAEQFEALERAAREALRPVVPHFLSDVKRGDKTVRQRMKESGYRNFSEKLNGGKKKANVCTLC